jgi:hypothetical protein
MPCVARSQTVAPSQMQRRSLEQLQQAGAAILLDAWTGSAVRPATTIHRSRGCSGCSICGGNPSSHWTPHSTAQNPCNPLSIAMPKLLHGCQRPASSAAAWFPWVRTADRLPVPRYCGTRASANIPKLLS